MHLKLLTVSGNFKEDGYRMIVWFIQSEGV